MRHRSTLPLLLASLTACGVNEVRPRPGEGHLDPTWDETVGPPSHVRDGGIDSSSNPRDGGGFATSPEGGVETMPSAPACAGVVCDVFAACTGADEPRCICAMGLDGDGQRCSDIDECQTDVDICGANAVCENSFGGYACNCKPGYKLEDERCVLDEACTESPCANNAACSDADAKLTCVCAEGYSGSGFFCTAEQPCADSPCGARATCISVAGTSREFVCACDLGLQGATTCAPCGEALVVEDPELDRAVRRQLGLQPDDMRPVLVSELPAFSSLNASDFGVTDLSGLECWSSLQVLDLSYNVGLTNKGAKALASLNQLTELRLDCTGVTDLGVIDGHPNLRSLSANALNCDAPPLLDSTSPIATMPQLEVLDLRGQALADAALLSGLRNLRSLWFGYNDLDSLHDFEGLPLLTELDVSFNRLETIDEVARLLRLQYLNVGNNEIESLAPTEGLTALRAINASGNHISALPDWSNSSLVQIDVSSNTIASVEPLAGLNRVAWVSVAGNAITTLAPLLEGSLRGTLVVAGNALPCVEQSSVIAELRAFGMDVQGECVP